MQEPEGRRCRRRRRPGAVASGSSGERAGSGSPRPRPRPLAAASRSPSRERRGDPRGARCPPPAGPRPVTSPPPPRRATRSPSSSPAVNSQRPAVRHEDDGCTGLTQPAGTRADRGLAAAAGGRRARSARRLRAMAPCTWWPRPTSSGAPRPPPRWPPPSAAAATAAGLDGRRGARWPTAARAPSTCSAAPTARTSVTGPLGDPVQAPWRLAGRSAVIEMARASGLDAGRRARGQRPGGGATSRHRRADRRRRRRRAPPRRGRRWAARPRPTAASARCGRSSRWPGSGASTWSWPATCAPASSTPPRSSPPRRAPARPRSSCCAAASSAWPQVYLGALRRRRRRAGRRPARPGAWPAAWPPSAPELVAGFDLVADEVDLADRLDGRRPGRDRRGLPRRAVLRGQGGRRRGGLARRLACRCSSSAAADRVDPASRRVAGRALRRGRPGDTLAVVREVAARTRLLSAARALIASTATIRRGGRPQGPSRPGRAPTPAADGSGRRRRRSEPGTLATQLSAAGSDERADVRPGPRPAGGRRCCEGWAEVLYLALDGREC